MWWSSTCWIIIFLLLSDEGRRLVICILQCKLLLLTNMKVPLLVFTCFTLFLVTSYAKKNTNATDSFAKCIIDLEKLTFGSYPDSQTSNLPTLKWYLPFLVMGAQGKRLMDYGLYDQVTYFI